MAEYRERVIFNTVRDALLEHVEDRDSHGAVLDDLADILAPEGWATGDFYLPPGWYADYGDTGAWVVHGPDSLSASAGDAS